MRVSRLVGFTFPFALAVAATPAGAQTADVKGVGLSRTVDCAVSPRVRVTGQGNEVRLTGRCEKVTLSGTGHRVRAEGLGAVAMSGLDHLVEWQYALSGDKPGVSDSGIGNRVVQVAGAAPAAAQSGSVQAAPATPAAPRPGGGAAAARSASDAPAAPPKINGYGVRRTYACNGGDLDINGSNHVIKLEGACGRVTVNGMGQRIYIESARAIAVNGMNQEVGWVHGVDGSDPHVASDGLGNKVRRLTAEEFQKTAP